jgi:hypothetical protein
MVGNEMFNFINLRLQEIMGNSLDFGGISVLAGGDFYQLKPVSLYLIYHQVQLSMQ